MAEVADEVLRALFDIAVSSMDFGSGFLDDEEVARLREVAELLGVDPMAATPENFRCKYRGHHEATPYLEMSMFTSFADGREKNAYNRLEGDKLAMDRSRRIGMWCHDCGRRWEAFEDTRLINHDRPEIPG
jgi:hypothetical protein